MKSTLVIILCLFLAAPAMAGDYMAYGPYAGLSLGTQKLETMSSGGADVTFDMGWSASASAGYHWPEGLRLEAEAIYLTNSADKVEVGSFSIDADGSLSMHAIMANVLWEFENKTKWFSYLGIGAGYGEAKINGSGANLTATTMMGQPILGIGYRLSDHVSMSMDYRYLMSLEQLNFSGDKVDYRSHRVGLGLRYAF